MNWRNKHKSEPVELSLPGPADDDDIDPFDPFPDGVRVPLTDILDLHTVRPAEIKTVVVDYLEDARAAGFRSVRLIHGKGIGVQRETVRSILSLTPFVDRYTDAPPDAGGWGATIAFFKR
ncbi:MAG: Smr/MutS family protein [Pyrinomonadaceae bacterium]